MKAITAIGIVCAFGALLVASIMEGTQPDGLHQHPRAAPDRAAARRRCAWRRRTSRRSWAMPKRDDHELQGLEHRVRRRHPGDGRPRREGPPQRPARARGGRRARSTTPTPRRASSWSSTAPTPISSGRSSSPRSTAWRSATTRSPACSRRPAASRRRSASSAPSWASSTCSRTCRRRRRSGRAISGAFIATLYGVSAAPTCIFLPDRQQAQGDVGDRGQPPVHGARGDPLDPGRRQPARARREARGLPAAGEARRPEKGAPAVGRGRPTRSGRRRERPLLTQRRGAARTAAAGTRAATSAGSSRTPT